MKTVVIIHNLNSRGKHINEKYIKVPNKYKKLVELRLFDENKLKTFRKKYKLDLKKESKLIELTKYFNEH